MPTTQQINETIIAQLEASLNQTIPLLPRAFLRVLAKVLAGVYVVLYKYADWMLLQLFVAHASNEPTEIMGRTLRPLTEWGRLIGVGDSNPATRAELSIQITVEQTGGTLPRGTQLVNDASGVVYLTTQSISLDASFKTVPVEAQTVGTVGNMDLAEPINFANSIAGVARAAQVFEVITTAADAETTEDYRRRIINRFQRRPQGGAYADYALWGSEPEGIANVYPYTGAPGEVDVYVEAIGTPLGIPTQAQLDAVYDAIQLDSTGLATRRPAGALVNTRPITRVGFNVDVFGLDVQDPGAVQQQIEAAMFSYFESREPYIVGLSVPPREDRITQSAVSGIVDRIVDEVGGIFAGVILTEGGLTVGTYILGEGEKARLSGISFS